MDTTNETRRRPPRAGVKPDHRFDYKNTDELKYYLSARGKLIPRRNTGLSAVQQRNLTRAIKRARILALLPYPS